MNNTTPSRNAGAARSRFGAARALLSDLGTLVAIASQLGVLPSATPPRPPQPAPVCAVTVTLTPGSLASMGDVDGLEEFGGLARWRDVLLRYPDGRAEPHRLVEVDGRLPYEVRLPLNEARTAYDRFVLSSVDVDVPVYDWADVEER